MIQRCEHLRFALEAMHAPCIAGEGSRQNLDRDVAIEFRIGRAIDRPHSALAELGLDAVMCDRLLRAHLI
jgi:hypothetical protein